MKKLLAILLALVMVLSLAACSEGDAEVEIEEEKGSSEEKAPEKGNSTEETGRSIEAALDIWKEIWNGDMSRYEEMVPEALWEQYKDVYADGFEEWLENSQAGLKDSVNDSLEKNGKMTLEIVDREELADEDVAMIAEAVTNMYELDGDQVKAAYKLDVEASYEKAEKESGEMFAMQYGEDWYLIMYTVYEKGECTVNFYI